MKIPGICKSVLKFKILNQRNDLCLGFVENSSAKGNEIFIVVPVTEHGKILAYFQINIKSFSYREVIEAERRTV